jgi:hypothetical protein
VERVWYNSCKHRCCPQCNQIQIERWLEFQQARLLACPHHHLIFTLPHQLSPLWSLNPGVMPGLLFEAVGDTVRELTGDPKHLGAESGFILTLHTWGRSLSLHPHIHCLITAGGLDEEGQWVSPRRKCFLPAPVVMEVFRGKFLAYLRRAEEAGELRLPQGLPPVRLERLLKKLKRVKWNVRVSARYLHGEGVVKYLARYVRGGPLKNSQILQVTETHVTYRYYDHEAGTSTELTVTHAEFIRRYLAHVPEHRQQVVRSFGLYAHTKTESLNQARVGHAQPPVERPPFLAWQAYYLRLTGTPDASTCPQCGAPLVPRALLPRRVHDPPLPTLASSRLYA